MSVLARAIRCEACTISHCTSYVLWMHGHLQWTSRAAQVLEYMTCQGCMLWRARQARVNGSWTTALLQQGAAPPCTFCNRKRPGIFLTTGQDSVLGTAERVMGTVMAFCNASPSGPGLSHASEPRAGVSCPPGADRSTEELAEQACEPGIVLSVRTCVLCVLSRHSQGAALLLQ